MRFVFPNIDPHFIETSVMLFITIISYLSANLAIKTQLYIFIIICCALLSEVIGNTEYITTKTVEIPLESLSFWKAFTHFFPAVTGIEVGFSMSGDLKDSSKSLPTRTIAAVLTGLVIYMFMAYFLWSHVSMDELKRNSMIMLRVSKIEFLILLGIWDATLSSAFGGILAAPRTLQALAKDNIVPKFLSKGYGAANEPRIATCITFVIAIVTLYFDSINILVPVLTIFFQISYGMLNLAAGLESLFGNPSWRPTFAIPSSVSLLGALFCVLSMLMIDPGAHLSLFLLLLSYILSVKGKN